LGGKKKRLATYVWAATDETGQIIQWGVRQKKKKTGSLGEKKKKKGQLNRQWDHWANDNARLGVGGVKHGGEIGSGPQGKKVTRCTSTHMERQKNNSKKREPKKKWTRMSREGGELVSGSGWGEKRGECAQRRCRGKKKEQVYVLESGRRRTSELFRCGVCLPNLGGGFVGKRRKKSGGGSVGIA